MQICPLRIPESFDGGDGGYDDGDDDDDNDDGDDIRHLIFLLRLIVSWASAKNFVWVAFLK